MAKARGKKSTTKIKDLPARKLSAKQAKAVKGGTKVISGTGMQKGFYNWRK